MPPATQETELTAAPTMSELSAANWKKRNIASTEGDVEDAQTRLTLPQDTNPLSTSKAIFLEHSHTYYGLSICFGITTVDSTDSNRNPDGL